MKKKYLKNCLKSVLIVSLLSLSMTGVAQTTYTFEGDTAGSLPANVTASSGTFTTDSDVSRTKTLSCTALKSAAGADNTASVVLDAFTSASNYSVTWKENYTGNARSGMLLRGGSTANTANSGMKIGYIFQVSPIQGNLRILKSTATTYLVVPTTSITKAGPGVGVDRWYRATVDGSSLKFEYSDNGTTFTTACTGTDTDYTSGTTQFTTGWGQVVTNLFVDNITHVILPNLSVKENQLTNLTLYPNPAKDTVKLSFDANNGETATGTIYDVQGKLVKTIQNKLENNSSIDVSSLTKGVYFLKIQSASAEQTKKLIIE